MSASDTQLDPSLQQHDREHAAAKPSGLTLNPNDYPGGIAIWGALPAVYDTTQLPTDDGVHVHARKEINGLKLIDETFPYVEVVDPENNVTFFVNGRDASNYNIATILGMTLKCVSCPTCDGVHADQGYESVHPHTAHVCEHCNFTFHTDEPIISNPIMRLKELCNDTLQNRVVIDPVERRLEKRQIDYSGGFQIWGSNPAVIWTSPRYEEGGVHVHAFRDAQAQPAIDNTYGEVTIDGERLDPQAVRYLMAQQALEHLKGRIKSISCPACSTSHMDIGVHAVDPHKRHVCEACNHTFESPEPLVANPLVEQLGRLHNLRGKDRTF